jgi:hypothetical protein
MKYDLNCLPIGFGLCIIYRLYKGAIHGKENKFAHDSSPIHVNYNLSNNIC